MKRYRSYSPLERALIAQLFHLKSNTRKVVQDSNPDLLHDLRGAVLRIDFALKYFNKWLNAPKKIKKMVKESRRNMARVRNLDILSSSIKKDIPKIKATAKEQELLNKVIQERHSQSRRELIKVLKSSNFQNFVDELELLIGYSKLPHTFPALKKILKTIAQWKKRKVSPHDLHPLRISLKELSYSCEFIQSEEQLHKVVKFQDLLGKRQDSITNIKLLKELPLKKVPRLASELCQKESRKVEKHEKEFYKRWEDTSVKEFLMLAPQ